MNNTNDLSKEKKRMNNLFCDDDVCFIDGDDEHG